MSNQINFKGIWIPINILLDHNLSDKEKIIISIVIYLSKDTNSCNVSNKYLSTVLNISVTQVSKLINSLKDKNYLEIKLNYKTNSKEIENRKLTPIVKNDNRSIEEKFMSNTAKIQPPIQQNNKDIINNLKNKNIYYNHKQNFKPSYANYEQRQYPPGFFDQFYANLPSEK